MLTHKWHELLVLSTCAFSAINSNTACIESLDAEIRQSMNNLAANLSHLNATSSGTVISCAQLELEAGSLVSELCSVRFAFKSIGLNLNEFVALKVIAMTSIIAQNQAATNNSQQQAQPDILDPAAVLRIRDRYLKALVSSLCHKKPPLGSGSCSSAALALQSASLGATQGTLGPNTIHVLARMHSLLQCLGQVATAANILLQSKMFYVPFLMNSSSITSSAAAALTNGTLSHNGTYGNGNNNSNNNSNNNQNSPPPSHHIHLGHLNQAAAAVAAAAAAAAAAANLHYGSSTNSASNQNGSSSNLTSSSSSSANGTNMNNGSNNNGGSNTSNRGSSSSPPVVINGVSNGVPCGPTTPAVLANGPSSGSIQNH